MGKRGFNRGGRDSARLPDGLVSTWRYRGKEPRSKKRKKGGGRKRLPMTLHELGRLLLQLLGLQRDRG